ncbi:hypothetical protein [Candidatus Clostridium radicumherbarum]|uniref:Uncharacterized protein n=1 Tax=Candidatus Clostridium radicumherbarum TaxID=3381662 RepID=A0ABW8TWR1_9CLOT
MRKKTKVIITFIISLIIAFFLVGYTRNSMFVKIDWVAGATIWDKFREYYIRTFSSNILPSLIIALIPTFILFTVHRTKVNK